MLAFKYISFHYIKYFLLILISLTIFLVGFDYMKFYDKLPESANLLLIYLVYKSLYAIDVLLPLSLIFGMISTKIFLIRSNALVSFYSLGYTRVEVLKPFVVVSFLVVIFFIYLHSLNSFSRANEYSTNIRKHSEYLSPTTNLFFTYKDQYVYISKMLPLQKKAEDIRVFSVKENSLKEVLVANSATYYKGYWNIQEADIIVKPDDMSFTSLGINTTNEKDLKILHGFSPKILDQVYEGKANFAIMDAINALRLLKDQNVNTDSIKSALYKIFIYPFFVPCLVVIIFFFVPISVRFLNVSLFSFAAVIATLIIWAVLFSLIELSNNKTIDSELGIIAPVVLLFIIALIQWRRFKVKT